ncbi:MAG: hypothetical protein GX264_09110 [Clostridiales bacterium]|jgi:endonuclease/exonuclease/phosphatase family metal-dependent hydrolase|nr:hypothetical protein [Clostridiales bacterium]
MKRREEPKNVIRIMSTNTLFDKTAADRTPLLYENYMHYSPDIIGFQEINKVFHEKLIPLLTDGEYAMIKAWPHESRKRESEKNSISKKYPAVNYFPILYKRNRFEEVESGFYMYRSTWTETKGVSWAVLSDRQSGKLLAHLNTHAAIILSSYVIENLTPDLDEEWRLDNCREMLETIAEIEAKYPAIPFFLTGDFNSNELSPSYGKYIESGFADAKYVAEKKSTHNIGTFHKLGELPQRGEDFYPIDHIFLLPDRARVLVHSIETRQPVLDASDHCMVYADVII